MTDRLVAAPVKCYRPKGKHSAHWRAGLPAAADKKATEDRLSDASRADMDSRMNDSLEQNMTLPLSTGCLG
jgi:hypothetical protein